MAIPLPEAAPPALDALIHGDLWRSWAERGRVPALEDVRAAVRYVRLKPGGTSRLTVFGDVTGTLDGPPPGFLLWLAPDARRGREALRKEEARRGGARGAFLCEESSVLVLPFPTDPDLRGLRHAHEPDRLRRALAGALPGFPADEWRIRRRASGTELLAYKPGRRAVYRVRVALRRRTDRRDGEAALHVKLSTPETIAGVRARLEALAAARPAGAEWEIPRPLRAAPDVLACEWIEGRSILALVERGDPAAAKALERTGRAVAGLHGLDARLDAGPSPSDEGARLRRVAADLARWLPERAARTLALGERIATRTEREDHGRAAPVHGDLHLDQVLLSDGAVYLVDLDRARRGRPAEDLGRLLGHLFEARAPEELGRAFLDGYASVAALPPGPSLAGATASSLLRRASIPLRALDPDWPREVRRRIERAEELSG